MSLLTPICGKQKGECVRREMVNATLALYILSIGLEQRFHVSQNALQKLTCLSYY